MSARRVQIDLNRRDDEGRTPARYSPDFGGAPCVGEHVLAFEPEDGVCVEAIVASVDSGRHRIALDVDWGSIRDDDIAPIPLVASAAAWLFDPSAAATKTSLRNVLSGPFSTGGSETVQSATNYSVGCWRVPAWS